MKIFPRCFLVLAICLPWPMPMAIAQTQGEQNSAAAPPVESVTPIIPYKPPTDARASFIKVAIVFGLMVVVAYGGIRFLQILQLQGFGGKRKTPLVQILESRKLDTKTNIHIIHVESERFLVAQNGHALQVMPLRPSEPSRLSARSAAGEPSTPGESSSLSESSSSIESYRS